MPLSQTQFSIPEPSCRSPTRSQIHLRHTSIIHKSPDSRSFPTQGLWLCLVFVGNAEVGCVSLKCLICFSNALRSFSVTWLENRTVIIFFGQIKSVRVSHKAVNVLILQVAGIKGMFLANKRTDNQVKTYITYNRGRDWRLLQAPSKDLRGSSIHCVLVSFFASASEMRSYMFLYVCASIKERPWQELTDPSSNESLSSERAAPVKAECSEAAQLKGQPFWFSPISWPPI